jgi:hypothetical protein
MTTEKLVNNALFGKTELANQKVELGIMDDLQTKSNLLNSRRLELNDFVASFVKSKNDANNKSAELLKLMGDFDKTLKKADDAAYSLGIEIPGIEKFMSLFSESQKSLDNFKSNVK